MKSMYQEWGFTNNPFTTLALPATDLGAELLVGRETEVDRVHSRLLQPPKAVTVEGPNGIGKTSIINVAAFKAFNAFVVGESDSLLIPCQKVFQLTSETNWESFALDVYRWIGQSLLAAIQNSAVSKRGHALKNQNAIDTWLNHPIAHAIQAGVNISLGPAGGGGLSGGQGTTFNNTEGFTRSGFIDLIRQWLTDMFPNGEGGGVVCVIDNLELLQTSAGTKRLLEDLRDPLLGQTGIRWVLSGASGIVRGVASSPRLSGLLETPIDVGEIPEELAGEILATRKTAYAVNADAYLPIGKREFESLYRLLRGNVRESLSQAANFCQWIYDLKRHPNTEEDVAKFFAEWIDAESRLALVAVQGQLRPRAWKTFETAVAERGVFSPSDFAKFGYSSPEAMRPAVKDLESVGLLTSAIDESDSRRKTITMTPRGWFVNHARERGIETVFAPEIEGENGSATPIGGER